MGLSINNNSMMYSLLSNLSKLDSEMQTTMTRLSTGLKINKASDDPAGLIALRSLESELNSVNSALENNQRTKSMLDTADSALTEVSTLVSQIESLADESVSSTLTADERAANQSQIDSALESLDRIINTTEFNGTKLFDGTNRITGTMSTADAGSIKDLRIYSRTPGTSNISLSVNVTAAATAATTKGTSIFNQTAALTKETVISVSGKEGTKLVTVASGSNLAATVAAINSVKSETGVSAAASGTQLRLDSTAVGSDAFVSASAISGDPIPLGSLQVAKKSGTDAVVNINNQKASVSGTEVFYNGSGVSLSFYLSTNTTGTRTITVGAGGGMQLQIGTDTNSKTVLGLSDISTTALGRQDLGYLNDIKSGGTYNLTTDAAQAAKIAKKAAAQVATAAARLGGFISSQLDSSINVLNATKENLSDTISLIGDADIAEETTKLQRQQLLSSAGTQLIAILGQQQSSILSLLTG